MSRRMLDVDYAINELHKGFAITRGQPERMREINNGAALEFARTMGSVTEKLIVMLYEKQRDEEKEDD